MEYTVRIPDWIETFFRLVRDHELETSFLSSHEQGKRRRQKTEDAADHRGISVREPPALLKRVQRIERGG